jgi:serpin B
MIVVAGPRIDPASLPSPPRPRSSPTCATSIDAVRRRPGLEGGRSRTAGSTLSLLVVLPVGGSVGRLEHQLDRSGLDDIVESFSRETVKLSLPRFHLTTQVELGEVLGSLGMPIAFDEAADFSGITAVEALKIGAVEHVAGIDVDEEGTEAAATTGIEVIPPRLGGPAEIRHLQGQPTLPLLRPRRRNRCLALRRPAH